MYEHLLYEVADGIAVISINNPKSLNALDAPTIEELGQCIDEVANDKAVPSPLSRAQTSPRWSR